MFEPTQTIRARRRAQRRPHRQQHADVLVPGVGPRAPADARSSTGSLARRATIREVVLLGDLFDVWTYPPNVRPPSMTRDHRRQPDAARCRAARSPPSCGRCPNRVRLLLGNHDGSLTRADVDTLNRSLGGNVARGERIDLITAPWHSLNGASGCATVFSHGHHWCMFNAPDARSRWGTIPVGPLRLARDRYQLSKTLRPGETTRRPAQQRQPERLQPRRRAGGLEPARRSRRLPARRYICRHTGMPQTSASSCPTARRPRCRTPCACSRASSPSGSGARAATLDAMRAASADWSGEDLAWFAQRLALRTASDLAVMGHTHATVGGIAVSPVELRQQRLRVRRQARRSAQGVHVHAGRPRARHRAGARGLADGAVVAPARAPTMPSVVRRPWMDYSCYARIENRAGHAAAARPASKDASSYWVVPPPAVHRAALARGDLAAGHDRGAADPAAASRTPTGPARSSSSSPARRACPGTSSARRSRATRRGRGARAGAAAASTGSGTRCRRASSSRRRARPASRTRSRHPSPGRRASRPSPRASSGRRSGSPRSSRRGRYTQGPSGAQRAICALVLTDRPTLTAADAARHLRIVPWGDRTRRHIPQGQAGSFGAAELTVRSGAQLARPQKDNHAEAVAFGGDRYETCVVGSLSRAVRDFYARQGLRHLHEIRVSEAASGRLADGQYHLLWNGHRGNRPLGRDADARRPVRRPPPEGHEEPAASCSTSTGSTTARSTRPTRPAMPSAGSRRCCTRSSSAARPAAQDRPAHRHAHRRADRRVRGEPRAGSVGHRRPAGPTGRPGAVQQLEPGLRVPLRGCEGRAPTRSSSPAT